MVSEKNSLNPATDIQELLLSSKEITPISLEQTEELRRISKLDVSTYSEADVRAEIIDPVIRILGYEKETYFSLQREKSLKILKGDLFIDYSMTLWSESFWVIEAKKVKRKSMKFIASELQQALQYASHPEIDAALVVLCDGRFFEIYDREQSVSESIARIEVKKIVEDFSILQSLLAPWQAWFFQKRRVLKVIDKVLDHEMIPGRLEEFKKMVVRRLEEKRGKIIENWRKFHPIDSGFIRRDHDLNEMSIEDLIEIEFFFPLSERDMNVIAKILVKKSENNTFPIIYRVFPDRPRDMNDMFIGSALRMLIEFDQCQSPINLLPSWLQIKGQPVAVDVGIKRLISLGLTAFDGDKSRKLILQYSAAARRLAKICTALLPSLARMGQRNHDIIRFSFDELSLAQYISTPGGQSLRMLENLQVTMTNNFLNECRSESGEFRADRAETMLEDLWGTERKLLGDGSAYWKGLAGRVADSEINPTEHSWVSYDSLGHLILCVIASSSKKWSEYVVKTHADDLMRLSRGGSWQARDLLGISKEVILSPLSDHELAQNFFYGNLALFRDLHGAYTNRNQI